MELQGIKINDFTREQIDALYPEAIMIMPMKVWTLPKNKKHMKDDILSGGKYIAQIKKDGYYYSYEKHEKNCYLFSKSVSKKTGLLSEKLSNVPHIAEILKKHISDDTILIGEIISAKGGSNEVTKIMGCLPAKACKRQQNDDNTKLRFYIHDISMLNGNSLLKVTTEERLVLLHALEMQFEELASDRDKMFIEFAETYTKDLGQVYSDAFANEEEGIVLKSKLGLIVPNKRPAWNTIKFKKELADLDVVCMGFCEPTYYYEGKELETWSYFDNYGDAITKAAYMNWIGSIRVGAYDENEVLQYIGTVSSGITEELLRKIKYDQEKFIGMPMVIGAMEPGVNINKLRHLYLNSKIGLLGFRDDIDPKDCTLAKIFN